MTKGLFREARTAEESIKWNNSISRLKPLYERKDDIRSPFFRDYNRILHCTAYRRLKHKTQVFFAPQNDHICTRIEHVNIVWAVSYTIATELGLNSELTGAIAIGHDLGHAPFGHAGEDFLKEIATEEIGKTFWHEKNSLHFVDDIEILKAPDGNYRNLQLAYAVRDGIICHCGEVDANNVKPRDNFIDLSTISKRNEYSPYTWEGCVVKIADTIAYLGRDIEDAITLGILTDAQRKEVDRIVRKCTKRTVPSFSNTVVMHNLIVDLCKNSDLDKGLHFSPRLHELMRLLKEFSTENIYCHKRISTYKDHARLILATIYRALSDMYDQEETIRRMKKDPGPYRNLTLVFSDWLQRYSRPNRRPKEFKNKRLYDLCDEKDYCLAILDFVAGMTDMFAVQVFQEITSF